MPRMACHARDSDDDGDNCILYWPEGLGNPSMGGGGYD